MGIIQNVEDGGTAIGQVVGNIYNYYASPSLEESMTIDLGSYRRYSRNRAQQWERTYTALHVCTTVERVGDSSAHRAPVRISLMDAVLQWERIALLGAAGAGKSHSLRCLSLDWEDATGDLSIYVELGRFRLPQGVAPLDSLLMLIAEELYFGRGSLGPPPLSAVRELLENGRILLLFDGLNEVASSIRASCAQALSEIGLRYEKCRMVIGARPFEFRCPPAWNRLTLCELDDKQVSEFLARYSAGTRAFEFATSMLANGSPVFRLPLFLAFVVDLDVDCLARSRSRLDSYSGLVAAYVEHIMDRESARHSLSGELVRNLGTAATTVAELSQRCGQSIPTDQVRDILEKIPAVNAQSILDGLGRCGLVLVDAHYVRFVHHTIQEHFFARAIAEDWKTRGAVILPWSSARKALLKARNVEALVHFVAFIHSPHEIQRAFSHLLASRPRLVFHWVDDLSAEGRFVPEVAGLLRRVEGWLAGTIRYSRFGDTTMDATIRVSYIFAAIVPLLGAVLALAANWLKSGVVGSAVALFLPLLAWMFILIDIVRSYKGKQWSLEVLAAIGALRTEVLKDWANHVATRLVRSHADRDLRGEAGVIVEGRNAGTSTISAFLARRSHPLNAVQYLAFARDKGALELLGALIERDNIFSRAAIAALAARGRQFPDETAYIVDVLRSVWLNTRADMKTRRGARMALKQLGESTGVPLSVVWYVLGRLTLGLALVIALVGLKFFPPLALVLAFLIYRDARALGAFRENQGFVCDGWSVRTWTLVTLLAPPLGATFYALNRSRIRRNALGIDWDRMKEVGGVGQETGLL